MRTTAPISARRRKRQKGSTLVESALCFLAFMFLTVGTMDFAYAIFASNFCSHAAREATRYASVNYGKNLSNDDIKSYVVGLAVGLDTSKISTSSTWDTTGDPGSPVTITVNYDFSPLAGLAIQSGFTLSSTSSKTIVH